MNFKEDVEKKVASVKFARVCLQHIQRGCALHCYLSWCGIIWKQGLVQGSFYGNKALRGAERGGGYNGGGYLELIWRQ